MTTTTTARPETCELLIVGNGVLGLSVGLATARRGARVVVCGKPNRPSGATPAAGAMLGCFGEVTTTLLASGYGRTKLGLARQARDLWPAWINGLDLGPGQALTTASDTIVLLNAVGIPDLDDRNFHAIQAALQEYEEPYEQIDVHEVDWIDPDPHCRPLRALRLPDEGSINCAVLLAALERAFQAAGGVLRGEEVASVDRMHGRVAGVTLLDGTSIGSDQVVLASGARTQQLLDGLPELTGRIPRVYGGYGVSMLLETADRRTPRSVLRTPNRAFACGLHLLPRGSGTVYVGATNDIEQEMGLGPCVTDVSFLLTCATRQLRRGLNYAIIRKVTSGYRPVSVDGFPLIGETSITGLSVVTGTYRDGLHLSPLLAEHVARRLTGQEGLCDITAFRPEREPIQAFSREHIVADAARHMIATGVEREWKVPLEWPIALDGMLRERYAATAAQLNDSYTPPAEFLPLLSVRPEMRSEFRNYYTDAYKAWH